MVTPVITAAVPRFAVYTATDGQTEFPITWAYLEEAGNRAEIYRLGALVATYAGGDGDMSCSPGADAELVDGVAGTATIPACALDDIVVVFSNTTPERDVRYTNPADTTRDNLNREMNRRVAVETELQEGQARSVAVPFGEQGFTLEAAEARADQLATFDEDGKLKGSGVVAATVNLLAGLADEIAAIAGVVANAALIGALAFITPGRNALRTLFDRFAEQVSAMDFVTDARGGAEEREKLLAGTSTMYHDATVAEIVAYASADGVRRCVTSHAHFVLENDVAGVHDIRWQGRGSIRIKTGPRWFHRPDVFNSSFALGYQNLYVSAAGSDSASGIASVAPLATMTRAYAILNTRRKPLPALHRILVVDGVNLGESSSAGVSTVRDQQLYIQALTTPATHNNTSMPPKPLRVDSVTAGSPPTIGIPQHGFSDGQKVFLYGLPKAGGLHDADGKVYTITGATFDTFQLAGVNGSGWPAYTGAGDTRGFAAVITGSRSGAIFYGAGRTGVWGMTFNAFMHVTVSHLTFAGWGGKSQGLNRDEGAVKGRFFSNVETNNLHVLSCTKGQMARDLSIAIFNGGYTHDCAAAYWFIHSRGTAGVANGSFGDTTAPVVEDCTVGADIWEGATTHVDCTVMINVGNEVIVRKNSHAVVLNNDFINTGAPKTGLLVQSGGHLAESGNRFRGGYQPPVTRQSGATLNAEPETLDERLVQVNGLTMGIGVTTKQTVLSTTIPQDYMTSRQHRLRATLGGTADNASSGTIILAAELDGVALTNWAMAGTGPRSWECEFELVPYGAFGAVRAKRRQVDSINGAGISYLSPAFVVGRTWRTGVRVATTVAGTLATSFEAGDTVDGVVLRAGDRILIKNQAAPAENGIYVVAASGAPSRAADVDTGAEIGGAAVAVLEGAANKKTEWACDQATSVTVGTDSLTFTQLVAQLSGALTITAIKASGDTLAILDAALRKTGW